MRSGNARLARSNAGSWEQAPSGRRKARSCVVVSYFPSALSGSSARLERLFQSGRRMFRPAFSRAADTADGADGVVGSVLASGRYPDCPRSRPALAAEDDLNPREAGPRRLRPTQFEVRLFAARKVRRIYANWCHITIDIYTQEVSHFGIVRNAVLNMIREGVSALDEFTRPEHLESRRTRGRPFAKGNPGRKPGSKNKVTVIGHALLKEAEEKLLRKAIEMAEGGDGAMLKFLLDRLLPKERCIELSANDGCDAVERCEAILEDVCAGRIAPNEGAALASLVASYVRIVEFAEIDERLQAIEKALQSLKLPDAA